ncbi:MAG: (d)CMP kinase [Crocinitomicaceae bacterium]
MSRPDKIVVAIDGFSSCGKSTLARELAKQLHYVFIDSGAMYRGVTLFALQNDCIRGSELDRGKLIQKLDEINLTFRLNPDSQKPELHLNGVNVSEEIRTPAVAAQVSQVATIREVREKMVAQQRQMGKNGGVVMDGRDIGSVVFPNAELKLFITAEIETRVQRRFIELSDKGIQIDRDEVKANLLERDRIDSTRKESPLIRTEDAIEIDNTNLSRSEQLEQALSLVQKKIVTIA